MRSPRNSITMVNVNQSISENISINLCIFLISRTYSINIKNKKGCLNVGFFFYFCMEMSSLSLLFVNCQYTGTKDNS